MSTQRLDLQDRLLEGERLRNIERRVEKLLDGNLRRAILDCIDDYNWRFYESNECVSNEDRLRFAERVEERYNQLRERGSR